MLNSLLDIFTSGQWGMLWVAGAVIAALTTCSKEGIEGMTGLFLYTIITIVIVSFWSVYTVWVLLWNLFA